MHPIAFGNRNGSFLSPSSSFSFFSSLSFSLPSSTPRCVVARVSRWSMNVSLASYRETFYSLMFRYSFIVLFFLFRKNCVWIKRGKIVASFRMNSLLSSSKGKKKEEKKRKENFSITILSRWQKVENFCTDSPKRRSRDTLLARGTTLAALRTE